jgi:hypothetical protein
VPIVIRLDPLILLEILGAFVDGIVGQMAIHIGQMLLSIQFANKKHGKNWIISRSE